MKPTRLAAKIITSLSLSLLLLLTACTGDAAGTPGDTPSGIKNAVSDKSEAGDKAESGNNSKTESETETESAPSSGQVTLEYFYTSYASEDDYFVPENPPQEYLGQSLLSDETYMCRYFVKLYETDYSESELIEKVYPGDWRGGSPPKSLPKPIATTTRCPDGEVPTKPYESNFLPEGSEIHIQDPYAGFSLAAAVYDTDSGKRMTFLIVTYYQCSTWYSDDDLPDGPDGDSPVPVPLQRAPKCAYIESAGYFNPQLDITVGPSKTHSADYLAARYYSAGADVPQSSLDEILRDAEYAGEIKAEVSRNMFVENDSESNFLPNGTKLYTYGESEAIALLPEPIADEDGGRYIVAVRLFRSGTEIDSADARKLIGGETDSSGEFIVMREVRAQGVVSDEPAEDSPSEESPSESSPSESSPSESSPSESSPSEDSPSEESPSEESPAEESPSEDISIEDNLTADSTVTLPGGKTIRISDIERIVLSTNSPREPDPIAADADSIIKVISAINGMELGEPYSGGWVGGNAILIYSGGKLFSQIAISDDEIFIVDSLDEENAKGVYKIISGGLSYEEWKAVFPEDDWQ